MRLPLTACLFTLALACAASPVHADLDPYADARAEARRELQLAKRDARHYWQVEYPRQRRALNAAIELTEAEIRRHKLLLREYRPFDRFTIGRPLSLTIEDLKLCIREAELRLNELRHERNNLIRFHSDEARLLDMRVAEARRWVIAFEGGELIEIGEPLPGR